MDYRAGFAGEYLAAAELGTHRPTVKIGGAKLVEMDDEKTGRTKKRLVISFEGKDRGLVLCRTNAICIAAMFGPETDGWVGKRITLYAAQVQFGRETVPGIRIAGSPDLEKPLDVEVKLPKKRPMTVTMQPTGSKS